MYRAALELEELCAVPSCRLPRAAGAQECWPPGCHARIWPCTLTPTNELLAVTRAVILGYCEGQVHCSTLRMAVGRQTHAVSHVPHN